MRRGSMPKRRRRRPLCRRGSCPSPRGSLPRMLPPRSPEPARLDDSRVVAFARLVGVVDRLRDPDGCPWDRKQTLRSMAPFLLEEAHEAVEAIERGDDAHAAEECGDVLMVVALISRIAQE